MRACAWIASVVAATAVVAGCGERDEGSGAATGPPVVETVGETTPESEPLTEPAPEAETEPAPDGEPDAGELRLWVSNQSFDDDPVHVTIAIDGDEVVDRRFRVKNQHNWISFDIDDLEPGRHTLTAISDTGASFEQTFRLPADQPRWMVVDYWYYPDDPAGRSFTMHTSDEPIYFM